MPIRVLIPTPTFCEITYSCDLAQVPKKNNIPSPVDCNTAGLTTFDSTTGLLTFTAGLDRFDEIYAGEYRWAITATIGQISKIPKVYSFVMNTYDWCESQELKLSTYARQDPHPVFVDTDYELKSAAIIYDFNTDNLIEKKYDIDCGEAKIVFYSEKDGISYDYNSISKTLQPESAFKQFS